MSDNVPESIPADGSVLVLFVPVIETPSTPTIDELTDPAVINLSCYLTDDGWNPSVNEEVSTDPRLCSRQIFEQPGRHTRGLEITYVYQGQDMTAADNLAFSTLRYRTAGYIATRWGADYEVPIEAGDLFDVAPAKAGIQQKQPPEANGRLKVMQRMFITGPWLDDVAVVAS